MAGVTRQGDMSTGHDSCAATALTGGSSNVFVNGMPCGRQGDRYAPHSCLAHSTHSDTISGGSSTVRVNSRPIARVGDSVSIAGTVAQGSQNVFAG